MIWTCRAVSILCCVVRRVVIGFRGVRKESRKANRQQLPTPYAHQIVPTAPRHRSPSHIRETTSLSHLLANTFQFNHAKGGNVSQAQSVLNRQQEGIRVKIMTNRNVCWPARQGHDSIAGAFRRSESRSLEYLDGKIADMAGLTRLRSS